MKLAAATPMLLLLCLLGCAAAQVEPAGGATPLGKGMATTAGVCKIPVKTDPNYSRKCNDLMCTVFISKVDDKWIVDPFN